MGFFRDFKNDMKQAVNELMPGNDEMVSEYDDEDMVNTLEETAEVLSDEYVNTMEDATPSEASDDPLADDILDEVDAEDLENFDLEDEDLAEPCAGQERPEEFAKSVVDSIRAEQAEKNSESQPEEPLQEESFDQAAPETAEEEPKEPETANEAVPAGQATENPAAAEEADKEQEEQPMAEEKIIEIKAMTEEKEDAYAAETAGDPTTDAEVSDSTTYITKGTRIEGNLFTDGSLDILGTVEGDVSCYGKLVVSGVINGKVNSGEIYANSAKINGEIVSAGSVKIGVGSIIVGNIEAQSAVVAGAINGDLDVKGPVIVDSTAVIMGNIKSRSVQINNGAVIEGFCSQCYSDIDVKSFFA